jgi:cell division protein FtsQ
MPSTPRQAGARARTRRSRAPRLALALGACLAILAGGAYVAARETSLFALRTLEVRGAQPPVVVAVEQALEPLEGTSLVSLDASDVERRLEALPAVRSAQVDRRFPHTIDVRVVQERPVAVVRLGDASWLVAASGRVIEALDLGELSRLPRIWLDETAPVPEPGATLTAEQGAGAARAVAEIPAGFPARVQSVRGSADELLFVLASSTELRLGPSVDVRRKLLVAGAVLEELRRERTRLTYLDVSLPERPVGASESQVEGQALEFA